METVREGEGNDIFILSFSGAYKVPYSFIKSVGEEYQVVKRGREYHGCEEDFEKKERESNIIFPIM